MDPLSAAASLATVIQIAVSVTRYLKEVKSGSEDRLRLREEMRSTVCLLEMLQDRVEDADFLKSDLASVRSLNSSGGPLEQLRKVMERLMTKLAPQGRMKQVPQPLLWPLSKSEVKEILGTIERQKTMLSLAIQNDVVGLSLAIKDQVAEVSELLVNIEMRQAHDHIKTMREEDRNMSFWLCPLNFWTIHHDIASKRTEGTGQWLLDSPQFKHWLNGPERILWCHGMPGAGKTVLASTVVDNLHRRFSSKNADIAIAMLYCNYKQRAEQTLVNLVSSLLQQMIELRGSVPEGLRALHQLHTARQTRPTRVEILELLQSIVSEFSTVYFVIDALDECGESDGTRKWLLQDLHKTLPDVHILYTSRYVGDIERYLRGFPRLEIRAIDADIRRYLESQMESDPRIDKLVQGDAALLTTIMDTVVEISDGMFLLAQLHMGALATKHTRKALRSALKDLPTGLDGTYEETMQRIDNQNKDDVSLARKVLSWISSALTPLTVPALQHAIAIMDLKVGDDLDEDDLPDEDILIAVCAGLVKIDKESNVIRLVHYTTQEFFERKRTFRSDRAHKDILYACITYLMLDPFQTGPCDGNDALRNRFRQYPFLRYAAVNWGCHAREQEQQCKSIILDFLLNKAACQSACQAGEVDMQGINDIEWRFWSSQYPRDVPALVFVASFGLTYLVTQLLDAGHDVHTGDNIGMNPTMAAAQNGHLGVVEELLLAGADVDSVSVRGATALMKAAEGGHVDTIAYLLDKGANLEAGDLNDRTSLYYAATSGQASSVRLLLDRGADINAKCDIFEGAMEGGYSDVVDIVGDRVKAVNGSTGFESAIMEAIMGTLVRRPEDTAEIEMLIKKFTFITASTEEGPAVLHLAAQAGNEEIVSLLLKHGVNVDARSDDGRSPLHYATFRGRPTIVDILLESGANVAAETNQSSTALHTAFDYEAHYGVVNKLLEKGANLNKADARGMTALHLAAGKQCIPVMELILQHGADMTMRDARGWTALQFAAACGSEVAVRCLLKLTAPSGEASHEALLASALLREATKSNNEEAIRCSLSDPTVDVTIPDFDGLTALHYTASHGQESFTQQLLTRGAAVNARVADSAYEHRTIYEGHISDESYRYQWVSPLHHAAGQGHSGATQILLSHGADVHAAGSQRYTALNVAAHAGHAGPVKVLLEHGARTREGHEHMSPLYWAASNGYEEVVRLLLEYGAGEEAGTEVGRETLVVAIERMQVGVVKLLEERGFKTTAAKPGTGAAEVPPASKGKMGEVEEH